MKQDYIKPEVELLQLISAEEASHFSILPFAYDNHSISFYIDNRKEELEQVREELSLLHGKKIFLEPLDSAILDKSIAVNYRAGTKKPDQDYNAQSDLLENIIEEAVASQASDIHLEVYKNGMRVRNRIDGKLLEVMQIPHQKYNEIINQVKIRSDLNITEKRLPQDGRIHFDDFDIRVSVLPTQFGEKIVMRLLRKEKSKLELENLGFSPENLKLFYDNVNKPNGIILISGPTGSGKTTTLYATLQYLNKISRNIVTVEDPIEYSIPGINQVQINEEIGLTFTQALKSFLRQDPDIIMLGEIRDSQTAQMAIRSALTGHLVLSTIHTNSAVGTVSRLQDMGIPNYLIADTLNVSIAQRLVRLLCPDCKKKHEADLSELLDENLGIRYQLIEGKHFKPAGCAKCHYTGFIGRRAIYELVPINETILQWIKEENTKELKVNTLSDQAINLVQEGSTSLEEVYPILLNQH